MLHVTYSSALPWLPAREMTTPYDSLGGVAKSRKRVVTASLATSGARGSTTMNADSPCVRSDSPGGSLRYWLSPESSTTGGSPGQAWVRRGRPEPGGATASLFIAERSFHTKEESVVVTPFAASSQRTRPSVADGCRAGAGVERRPYLLMSDASKSSNSPSPIGPL